MKIRSSIDLELAPKDAFDTFVPELSMALEKLGMRLEEGPAGSITENSIKVGRVKTWIPERRILLEWRQADWEPNEVTKVELKFQRVNRGTRITLTHHEWGRLIGDRGAELAGWFASDVAARLLFATGPRGFGDWLTDRNARRPSGAKARGVYRNPMYHRPNFRAILDSLQLKPNDYLIEVGCGGGAFLQMALLSGCRAAAVDHSPDMVRLAQEVNRSAVSEGRLEIREAEADSLPYEDALFTCAVMTGVFGFLSNPIKALSEMRRVLMRGGRLAVVSGSGKLRGTPAVPEPMASRLHFYEDDQLVMLTRKAGFENARVENPDLEQFAREAGVPEQALELFSHRGGSQLLLAMKE